MVLVFVCVWGSLSVIMFVCRYGGAVARVWYLYQPQGSAEVDDFTFFERGVLRKFNGTQTWRERRGYFTVDVLYGLNGKLVMRLWR